jgi:hypothetical protein
LSTTLLAATVSVMEAPDLPSTGEVAFRVRQK